MNRPVVVRQNNHLTIAWVFLLSIGFALTSQAGIRLDSQQARQNLGYEIYYYQEKDKAWTIDEASSKSNALAYRRADGPVPNFGIVNDAFWFRLAIDFDMLGQSQGPSHRILSISYPFLDHIEFYTRDANGQFQQYISGDHYPFSQRQIRHQEFAFNVYLQPQQTNEIYFRVKTSTSLQLPIEIWTSEEFGHKTSNEKLGYGIFYGALLVMFFYNLFLFISVKDRNFLNYIAYIATIILAQASVDGLTYQYIWPNYPFFANICIPIFINLCVISAVHFGVHYLNTKDFSPKWHMGSWFVYGLGVLAFLPLLFGQFGAAVLASTLMIVVMSVYLFSLGAYGMYKKQRRAYFFFAAWLLLFIGTSVRSLSTLDVLPTNFVTFHGGQIGIALELILLSLGLADRMNQDRTAKYEAIKASLSATEKALQITEEKRITQELLITQSLYDQLTGHPNRLKAREELKNCILASSESGNMVSLACLHLGNFQDINNTLGHDAGDKLLRQFIRQLDSSISKHEYVHPFEANASVKHHIAVFEGVYLGVIVVHPKHVDSVEEIRKIMDVFEAPVIFKGMALTLQGQAGVASWPNHGGDPETLLRKAMIAVRSAKWSRKTIQTYEESIDLYSAKRLSLMGELKNAIVEDQLELYYQPKINFETGEVVSLEALIRWHHPSQGILGPEAFIALAENTGIIQPLTAWVIENAASFGRELFVQGYDLSIAVNVSARNLLEENFVEQVTDTLAKNGLKAEGIILEVVESSMIEDMELCIGTLERLNQLGVGLSIDDFGTGYSSLEYLKKLPVNELKIDRSFISDLAHCMDDKLIVQTTLAIAHQLGLKVVAEGIENKVTLELLKEMGCDLGQGFYITHPLSTHDLLDFVKQPPWPGSRRLKIASQSA